MDEKARVSAIVLTLNEERHIAACLATLTWADALVVLDSGSVDRTVALAQRYTSNVHYRPFDDWAHQRNAALDLATTEWILFVDADERVTPELAAEVRRAVAGAGELCGYWVPRRNRILGRWMRATGWWPDEQLRLLRRGRVRYREDRPVHELVVCDGPVGHLRAPLLHYNYDSLGQLIAKQRRYARLEAGMLHAQGVPVRAYQLLSQPLREFVRRFMVLRGYRDGLHGLFLSLVMAWYVFMVRLFLLQRRVSSRPTS